MHELTWTHGSGTSNFSYSSWVKNHFTQFYPSFSSLCVMHIRTFCMDVKSRTRICISVMILVVSYSLPMPFIFSKSLSTSKSSLDTFTYQKSNQFSKLFAIVSISKQNIPPLSVCFSNTQQLVTSLAVLHGILLHMHCTMSTLLPWILAYIMSRSFCTMIGIPNISLLTTKKQNLNI